jgi:hypothetical protein
MKDELTKQCKMAWERGFKSGLAFGIAAILSIAIIFMIVGILIVSL